MKKRVDYQNPNDDLEAVHERRNAQIRAWAKADQDAADERMGVAADHVTTVDDWDALDEPNPHVAEEDTYPQDEPEGDALDEEIKDLGGVDNPEDGGDEPKPEPEPEPAATPARKTPAKKAAAAPKEAPSKA